MQEESINRGELRHSDPLQPETDCPHCRRAPRRWDRVHVLWAYEGQVRDAVVAAKFALHASLGDAMGRRLGELVRSEAIDDRPELVTFVSSHLFRRISRGGTGTAIIAGAVANVLHRPCRGLVRPTRAIAKQAMLHDEQRTQNVAGAFAVKKRYALRRPPRVPYRHVLLVDDVLTTGATANEIAGVLKGNGVERVSLAVIARAIRTEGVRRARE